MISTNWQYTDSGRNIQIKHFKLKLPRELSIISFFSTRSLLLIKTSRRQLIAFPAAGTPSISARLNSLNIAFRFVRFLAIKGRHSFIDVIYWSKKQLFEKQATVSLKAFHIHNCDLYLFLYSLEHVTASVLYLYFMWITFEWTQDAFNRSSG